MAKAKDKAGKSGKADKKGAKLPKRIAGVKVPKEMRKSGGKVVDALSHPLIADVAAAALLAAAAALRNEKTIRKGAAQARDSVADGVEKAGRGAKALSALVADAAEAGIRQLKALDVATGRKTSKPKAPKKAR